MQRGVGTGVGGAVVGGVEQLLRADGVWVPPQVAVLHHHAAWREGVDGWPHVDLRDILLAKEGRELRGIVAGEFLPRCRHRLVGDGQFLPRLAKRRQRLPWQRTTGGDEEFLAHGREIPLHRLGGDRSDRLQPRECLLAERFRRRAVHRNAQQGERHQRHRQQCREDQIAEGSIGRHLHLRRPYQRG